MNECKRNQNWTHVVTEVLPDEEGEIRLILDEDRTSIEISTGEGKRIELVPTKDGDLEIYMEDNYQTRMLKKEFLKKISKRVKEKFGLQLNEKNFINRSVLAALIKLRTVFKKFGNRPPESRGVPYPKSNR